MNRWWPTFLRIYASCGLEDLTNAAYYKGTYFGTEAHRELERGATQALMRHALPGLISTNQDAGVKCKPIRVYSQQTDFLLLYFKLALVKYALYINAHVLQFYKRGDRDTLLMLYRAIVRSKLDYGCMCMAQHQTPTYDNWTAFITLDWNWHWEHSAPAQCPAYTQRPTKLLWRNVD